MLLVCKLRCRLQLNYQGSSYRKTLHNSQYGFMLFSFPLKYRATVQILINRNKLVINIFKYQKSIVPSQTFHSHQSTSYKFNLRVDCPLYFNIQTYNQYNYFYLTMLVGCWLIHVQKQMRACPESDSAALPGYASSAPKIKKDQFS